MRYHITVLMLCLVVLSLSGCKKSDAVDNEETGQQVGDVMASIDESGGSGGSLTRVESEIKTFERLAPEGNLEALNRFFLTPAYAATCAAANTFGSCSGTTLVRTFGDCTILGATLSGTVTITWGGTATSCALLAAGDTITRVPAFTLTGRRGATLTVSKTGSVGQKLTWSSGSGSSKVFSFTNDGIKRVFTLSGATLFDYTTETTEAITVTGTLRSSRVMNNGKLKVTNNLSGTSCTYVPSNVTWSATCNCASSGTWTGTCSDSKTSSITLTGCGTANLTVGDTTQSITFDRCYGL